MPHPTPIPLPLDAALAGPAAFNPWANPEPDPDGARAVQAADEAVRWVTAQAYLASPEGD